MPTISSFYGILIRMFFNDHAPAHFHVQYAEYKATVDAMYAQIKLQGEWVLSQKEVSKKGEKKTSLEARLI